MVDKPYEVLLNTEQMCFFTENQFGHDPGLHDWGPNAPNTGDMAGARINQVFQQNPHLAQNGGGQINIEQIQATNDSIINYGDTGCAGQDTYVELTIEGGNVTDVIDVIILDRATITTLTETQGNVVGYAPGYVHTRDGTYPPFNFEYGGIAANNYYQFGQTVTSSEANFRRTLEINAQDIQDGPFQIARGNYLIITYQQEGAEPIKKQFINLKGLVTTLPEAQLQGIMKTVQSRYGDIVASYINTNTLTKYENYRNYLESGILGSENRFNLIVTQDNNAYEAFNHYLGLPKTVRNYNNPPVPYETLVAQTHHFQESLYQLINSQIITASQQQGFSAVYSILQPIIINVASQAIPAFRDIQGKLKTYATMLEPLIVINNNFETCLPAEYKCKPSLKPDIVGGFSCKVDDLSVNTLASKLCLNTLPDLNLPPGLTEVTEDLAKPILQYGNDRMYVLNAFTTTVNLVNDQAMEIVKGLPEQYQAYWCLLRLSSMEILEWIAPAGGPDVWDPAVNPYSFQQGDVGFMGNILASPDLNGIDLDALSREGPGGDYKARLEQSFEQVNEQRKIEYQQYWQTFPTGDSGDVEEPPEPFEQSLSNFIITKRLLATCGGQSWDTAGGNLCDEIANLYGKSIFFVNSDLASSQEVVWRDATNVEACRGIIEMSNIVNNFKLTLTDILARLQENILYNEEENDILDQSILTDMQRAKLLYDIATKVPFQDPAVWSNPVEILVKLIDMYKKVIEIVEAKDSSYVHDLLVLRQPGLLETPDDKGLQDLQKFVKDTTQNTVNYLGSLTETNPALQAAMISSMQNITLTAFGELTDQELIFIAIDYFPEDYKEPLEDLIDDEQEGGGRKKVKDTLFIPTAGLATNALDTSLGRGGRQQKSQIINTLTTLISDSHYPEAFKQKLLSGSETSNWRFNINEMFTIYFDGMNANILDRGVAEEVIQDFGRFPLYLSESSVPELIIPINSAKDIFNKTAMSSKDDIKAKMDSLGGMCKEIAEKAYAGNQEALTNMATLAGMLQQTEQIPGIVDEGKIKNVPDEYDEMVTLQQNIGQMLNNIIFFVWWGSPQGQQLQALESFQTANGPLLIPVDINVIGSYFLLLSQMLVVYSKLIDKASEVLDNTRMPLAPQVASAAGYALGAILLSIKTEVDPINEELKKGGPTPLLELQNVLIEEVLSAKANERTKLKSASFGDNDTKLYKGFVNYLKDPALSKNWVNNAKFYATSLEKGTKSKELMFKTLKDNADWADKKALTEQMLQTSVVNNNEPRYYINNAVTARLELGELMNKYFCPIFSVMDNMPQCGNAKSAALLNGYEWGVLDIIIHDGKSFYGGGASGSNIEYRVRVQPEPIAQGKEYPEKAYIAAYLKIGNNYAINVGAGMVEQLAGNFSWPKKVQISPAIEVPLTKNAINPLDAKVCLNSVLDLINNPQSNFYQLKSMGYEQMLNYIKLQPTESPPADMQVALNKLFPGGTPSPQQLRRALLERSFVKGLGDTLQELAGVVTNSGYTGEGPIGTKGNIASPDTKRLQLSNDRPSGIRAILLLLYGRGDIAQNAVAGYLTKDRYAVAARAAGGGKGGKTKKKRTRRKVKKKKKTRKAKPKRGKTRKARKPKKKTRGKRNNKKRTK